MLEGNRVLTHTFSKKLELQINIRGCRGLLLKIEDNRGKKLLDGSGCYVEEKKKKRETRYHLRGCHLRSRVYVVYFYHKQLEISKRELKFPHLRIFMLGDEIIIFDSTLSSTPINRIFLR